MSAGRLLVLILPTGLLFQNFQPLAYPYTVLSKVDNFATFKKVEVHAKILLFRK